MLLSEVFHFFSLDKQIQESLVKRNATVEPILKQQVMPVIRKSAPYLWIIARDEAAQWFKKADKRKLTQNDILKYILYYKDYIAVEISRIVKYWRLAYGINKQASS
jgi:hypothetical protein